MKVIIPKTLALALVAAPSLLLAQGPLQPPTTATDEVGPNPPLVAGSPAPTMKTLHQVEPRTPVSAATTPGDATNEFLITASGSYYLTQNLVVAGKNAIGINAADVTLDLNGFTISGFGSTSGIFIGADADRCTIRNGHIFNFTFGVNRELDEGDQASGGAFENLTVTGHSSIGLLGGASWTVSNCRVYEGQNSGINVGAGSVVTNSTVRDLNGSFGTAGIDVGSGGIVRDCTVTDCIVLYGIHARRGSTVENCTSKSNSGDSAIAFSYGIRVDDRCLIRGCSVLENTHPSDNNPGVGAGIFAGFSSLVIDCHVYANKGDGIIITQGCRVTGCRSSSNGSGGAGAGVHAVNSGFTGWNEIIDNDFIFNRTGIDVDTTENTVVRNRVAGSSSENFNIVNDNRVGPIVIPLNSGPISGSGAGQASGMGTTNPWANFTY